MTALELLAPHCGASFLHCQSAMPSATCGTKVYP